MSIFSKKTNAPSKKPAEFSFETPAETNTIPETNPTSETNTASEKNTLPTKKESTKEVISKKETMVNEETPRTSSSSSSAPNDDSLSIEKIVALFNSLPPVDVTIATVLIKQTLVTVGVDIHKVVQQLKDRLLQCDHQESQIQKDIYALQQKLSELTAALDYSAEEQESLRRILFLLSQNDTIENLSHTTLTNSRSVPLVNSQPIMLKETKLPKT